MLLREQAARARSMAAKKLRRGPEAAGRFRSSSSFYRVNMDHVSLSFEQAFVKAPWLYETGLKREDAVQVLQMPAD